MVTLSPFLKSDEYRFIAVDDEDLSKHKLKSADKICRKDAQQMYYFLVLNVIILLLLLYSEQATCTSDFQWRN